MKIIELKDIEVGVRGRKDFGDISGLSESIKKHGIISPILVEKTPDGIKPYKLIAGERRYRASIFAGNASIPASFREDLTDIQRRELEIEENVQRQDLLWSEVIQMEADLDALKREQHNDAKVGGNRHQSLPWTLKDTATMLNQSAGKTSQDLKLAKALKDPEIAKELLKYPKAVAYKKLLHIEERNRLEKKYKDVEVNREYDGFVNMSCIDWLKDLKAESVDLVITDPPFAVETINEAKGTYNDLRVEKDNSDADDMTKVYEAILPELFRVLKEGSHLYMFHAPQWYPYLLTSLRNAGFHVSEIPLIWDKMRSTTPFRGYEYQQCYEPIIFCCKPPRGKVHLNKPSVNILKVKPIDQKVKRHVFHKPPELIDFLITQSSQPGQVVIDPFAGSAQVIKSAVELKRVGKGSEINKDHYLKALEYLKKDA